MALWKVDTINHKLVKITDLPGCGETAFTSIVRVSKHKYLLANASSQQGKCNTWHFNGQLSDNGSNIYTMDIDFEEIVTKNNKFL